MFTTAVLIPTFNRRSTVSLALSALIPILPQDHRVVVIDSGSMDGTAELVRCEFPMVDLIAADPSCWWAAAINLGIRKAQALGCKYVVTYNDDNVATPGLFSALQSAAAASPRSIIAAVCCYLHEPAKVFFAGRIRAKGSDRFYYLDHNTPLANLGVGLRSADMLHGMCTLFPIAVFETVGLIDEEQLPQAFADDDLLLRAKRAGFTLEVALEAVVLNDRSKTGLNPYDRRLNLVEMMRLLTSRRSTFQLTARTRFLWRYRRSLFYFLKTWTYDYTRLLVLVVSRWVLSVRTFQTLGALWNQWLEQK